MLYLPCQFPGVIEASQVQVLPEELQGRLCSVLLRGRHVQVINEHHHLAVLGRPQDIPALLDELEHDLHLGPGGRGLSAELDHAADDPGLKTRLTAAAHQYVKVTVNTT